MPCSDAQRNANRMNALKSSGPKTEEGKAKSRQNGLKHGLTGSGLAAPEHDQAEVDALAQKFEADLKPKTAAGLRLIHRMALCSVRMDRAAVHDFAATAHRVRHAALDFDEARRDEAARIFDNLHEDPRNHLRKLRMSPEGVQLLIDQWTDLVEDLTADPDKPLWTASQMERAALMTGTRPEHSRNSRVGALSRGVWGDFARLSASDGGQLGEDARQAWAKGQLLGRIEAEIAELEAHRETLDFDLIEIDRAEAGDRTLFDASKGASLARRYESEASRGFFQAMKEFRRVESESAAELEAVPPPPPPFEAPYPLGSDRERDPGRAARLEPTGFGRPIDDLSVARGADGRPLVVGRGPQTPG